MPATKELIASRAAALAEDAPLFAKLDAIADARDADDGYDMEDMATRAEAEGRLRRTLTQQVYARASRSY